MNKNNQKQKVVAFGIVMAALVACTGVQQAQAATTADTVVTLQMDDYAAITATPTALVEPSLADVGIGSVITADNPITLTISSTNGSQVTFTGTPGTSPLANADLALSSDGNTWIPATDGSTPLAASGSTQSAEQIPINIKISNLGGYEVTTGGTNYTNTVTFTVVAAD